MHSHHWRATSKVFALVCECGLAYQEWLLAEIDRLKAAAALPSASISVEEVEALRAQLEETRRESDALRADRTKLETALDEARRELEAHAAKVTSQIGS